MYAPAVYQIVLAMGIGTIVSFILSKTGMTFPVYIGSMIIAAIMRNISEYTGKFTIHMGEINDIGSICLSLFLGVAMITLKLWQLAALVRAVHRVNTDRLIAPLRRIAWLPCHNLQWIDTFDWFL